MNSFWVVVIGAVIITAAYNLYAKRIDRTVIQADSQRATPARMYMDGADFMPTSRFVLYGYHFKSIAAAGPIVGVITAAALWGWLPAIAWLMLGVSFIGWASDYSAIMVAVRNDGNSLSAIAHWLITPRTRTILFVFIFFYLLLVGAAFVGIMAAILDARPDVPFGVLVLALMGLLAGYMIYRARANLMLVTAVVVGATLVAMTLGPIGVTFVTGKPPTWSEGPISGVVNSINSNVNGGGALYGVQDPTGADPRITRDAKAKPISSRTYDAKTGTIQVFSSYVLWAVFLLVFSYLGANLPIWRFAQPVNYIGFWVTALAIGLSAIGALIAPLTDPAVAKFKIDAFSSFVPTQVTGAFQPLWPMLFVTIACGAISGWHALFGSVGTARQIEYETDALPVAGGDPPQPRLRGHSDGVHVRDDHGRYLGDGLEPVQDGRHQGGRCHHLRDRRLGDDRGGRPAVRGGPGHCVGWLERLGQVPGTGGGGGHAGAKRLSGRTRGDGGAAMGGPPFRWWPPAPLPRPCR